MSDTGPEAGFDFAAYEAELLAQEHDPTANTAAILELIAGNRGDYALFFANLDRNITTITPLQ